MASDPSLDCLLRRIAAGDSAALAEFYQHTIDPLYGLAVRMLGSSADADDTVQEVFVVIWEKAHSYDPDAGTALAWAAGITRNRAIDRIRTRKRAAAAAERLGGQNGNGTAPPSIDSHRDARTKIKSVLETLSPQERTVIEMAFFDGKNHEEISRLLGCPSGTIKARIRRGMAKLRGPLLRLRTEVLDG